MKQLSAKHKMTQCVKEVFLSYGAVTNGLELMLALKFDKGKDHSNVIRIPLLTESCDPNISDAFKAHGSNLLLFIFKTGLSSPMRDCFPRRVVVMYLQSRTLLPRERRYGNFNG